MGAHCLSILGKTAGLLRVRSGGGGASADTATGFVPRVAPEELKPVLSRLVRFESLESADAGQAIEQLRVMAQRGGLFLTASEIQRCLKQYPMIDDAGGRMDCTRAYEFAAKLHWDHIHDQLGEMQDSKRKLGPTVYMTFLEELIECLIRSKDGAESFQIPVVLAEELLLKVLDPTVHSLRFLALGRRTLEGVLDYCDARSIADGIEAEFGAGNGGGASEFYPTIAVDPAVVEYLRAEFGMVRGFVEDVEALFDSNENTSGVSPDDVERKRTHILDYLEALLSVMQRHDCPPIRAACMQRLGEMRRKLNEEPDQPILLEAAALFDAQAEKETGLGLDMLASRRHKDAEECRAAD